MTRNGIIAMIVSQPASQTGKVGKALIAAVEKAEKK